MHTNNEHPREKPCRNTTEKQTKIGKAESALNIHKGKKIPRMDMQRNCNQYAKRITRVGNSQSLPRSLTRPRYPKFHTATNEKQNTHSANTRNAQPQTHGRDKKRIRDLCLIINSKNRKRKSGAKSPGGNIAGVAIAIRRYLTQHPYRKKSKWGNHGSHNGGVKTHIRPLTLLVTYAPRR